MGLTLGVFVGLVLGLTGAGGSILAVPLLMAGLGWPITQAATVSLLAVTVAAGLGTGLAWRQKYVRYRAASLMAAVGIVSAPLGIRIADRLPTSALVILFAIVLGIVAIRMFRQAVVAGPDTAVVRADIRAGEDGEPGKLCRVHPATGRLVWTWSVAFTLGAIGAATGFLSGLLGVGGGFVVVPALRAATPLSMHSAVATSLMAIAITSLGTVVSGLFQGRSLPIAVALPFVAGTVLGMTLGRWGAPRMAGPHLQQGFAILAALASFLMVAHAVAWL